MTESLFQYNNPCITKLLYQENDGFILEKGKSIEISNTIDVVQQRIDENSAVVKVNIVIGKKDTSVPFFAEIETVADFRWEVGINNVDALLSQNAPALLLSYSRPIIAMITNASHFPVYNIPFMNFTEKNGQKID